MISAFGVNHPEPVSKIGFASRAATRLMMGPEKNWKAQGLQRTQVLTGKDMKRSQVADQLNLVGAQKGRKLAPDPSRRGGMRTPLGDTKKWVLNQAQRQSANKVNRSI